jgi:Domain of unknown function (DUF1707)
MRDWAGSGFGLGSNRMLASEADREATQAVLKQAFEDQRLMLDEFESRVGRALAAQTQGELAQLTRDIPTGPGAPVTGGRAPAGPQLNRWGKEESRGNRFRLVPPVPCPSCGAEIRSVDGDMCYSCGRRTRAVAKRVPHLIRAILVTLPLLDNEPTIVQYLTRAPQDHTAILALTAAVIDVGVRFRSTYPDQDLRIGAWGLSGMEYLSADDIWMLDLTLDVLYMLALELTRAGSQRRDLDDHDDALISMLRRIFGELHDPRWGDDYADDALIRFLGRIAAALHDRRWKRALRQAGAGPAQFRQLRAHVPPRASYPRQELAPTARH